MRQVILVILLVSAAFLGGAFINGPGLQWAQSRAVRLLGLNSVGEIAAVDLETSPNGEIGADSTPIEQMDSPATKPKTLPPSQEKSPKKNRSKSSTSEPASRLTKNSTGSKQSREASLPSAVSGHPVTESSSNHVAPLDQNVVLARGDSQPQSLPASTSPSPARGVKVTEGREDNLPDLLSPDENPPATSSFAKAIPSTQRKPLQTVDDEWTLLESKMQSLGVSRFTIEGKPGGPIVFSCVIPVAGRQAVAERFEAEGNDVVHAAQSVLRRIVLWHAAQSPHGE